MILKIKRRKRLNLWPYAALLPQEAGIPGVYHTLPVDAAGPALCRCHFQIPHLSHTPLWVMGDRRLKGSKSQETNMKEGCDSAFCLIVMRHFDFSLHTHYKASPALGFRATRVLREQCLQNDPNYRSEILSLIPEGPSIEQQGPSGSKKVTLKHLFCPLLFQIINLEKR